MTIYRLILLNLLLVGLGDLQLANATLIENGSFEDPPVGGWHIFTNIPGWTGGVAGIEVQRDKKGVYTASGIALGEQFVELDTDRNSSMFQDVPTNAGTIYELTFGYAPRHTLSMYSRPTDSNDIEVIWEGIHVALMGGRSFSDLFRQEEWVTRTFQVTATSMTGFSRLEFFARGTSDSAGGLIDRVSLIQVPEPSTMILMMIGVVCLLRRSMSCCLEQFQAHPNGISR
jgi:hypothetical protein